MRLLRVSLEDFFMWSFTLPSLIIQTFHVASILPGRDVKSLATERVLQVNIISLSIFKSQLSFVAHTRGMKECVESLIDPAIEVTIERRQSRATSAGRLKRMTGEDQRQSVLKTTTLPAIADSNMNVKL